MVATAAASTIHFIHNSKTEFVLSVPGVVTSLLANETKSIIYATTSTLLLAIQTADSVPVTASSPPRVTCIQSFSSVITSCIILSSVNGFSSGHHLLVSCQDCAIYLVSFETPTPTTNDNNNNSDNSPQHPPPPAQPPSPPPIRQIQTRVVVPASEFGSCAWVSSMCLNREPEKPVIVAAATEGMAKFLKLAVVCSDGTLTAFDVVRGGGGGGGDSGDVSGYHDSIQLVAIRKNELKRAGSSGSSGGVGGGDDGEKRRAHALDSVLRVARGDDDVFMWKEGGGNGGGGGETGGESVAKRSRVVQGDGMEDVKIDHVVAAVSSGETGTPMVGVQQGGKPVVHS
ncbi:hypothetical protein BDR26DRAFT_314880 [Obelidium mucronatum]|nr:hypothetical protein BDR26DRAFT_314880 [Obelidium mucronatum]